jgi:predicted GNAT family acetyltransferase
VNPAYEGRGFGSRLAESALDDARRQGLAVVPLCPFITWYVDQHPEHGDLVAADYVGRRDES